MRQFRFMFKYCRSYGGGLLWGNNDEPQTHPVMGAVATQSVKINPFDLDRFGVSQTIKKYYAE